MSISNVLGVLQLQVWDFRVHGADGEFWGAISQAGDGSGGSVSLGLNLINRGEYLETFYRIDDLTAVVNGDNNNHEAYIFHQPALSYSGAQMYFYHKADLDGTSAALNTAVNKFLVDGWFPVWHRLPESPTGSRFGVAFADNNAALIYQLFIRGSVYFPRLNRFGLISR